MPSNPAQQINNVGTQPIPNDSIFHGIINSTYVKGITSVSWNSRSGGTSKIVFKGQQEDLMPLVQLARQGGYEYDMVGGHVWTLTITFPFDVINDPNGEPDPLFTWELINVPFEKDILELGDRPFNSVLTTATSQAIENKLKNSEASGIAPWAQIDNNNGSIRLNAQIAYTLKQIGVHGRQSSLQTIRKTMIISNFYNNLTLLLPEYDYHLFTTTQWLQVYNNDSNPLNQLPTPMFQAIPYTLNVSQWINGNITTVSSPGSSYGNWNMDGKGIVTYVGWIQFPSEIQMVSLNKVQITQQWTFNQWSAGPWGLYPVYQDGDAFGNTNSPNPNNVLNLM